MVVDPFRFYVAGGDDALERQKNSDHFMLAISADRFESSPDGNLGEILKFIPGLQVNYADGQASTVSFRGQDAARTAVMIGEGSAEFMGCRLPKWRAAIGKCFSASSLRWERLR